MLAGLSSIALAGALVVPSPQYATFADAAADAGNGDLIVLAAGSWPIPPDLNVDVTITGAGIGSTFLVLEDTTRNSAFTFDDVDVVMQDLTLDGLGNGRLIRATRSTSLVLTRVEVVDGDDDPGALLSLADDASLVALDCRFAGGRGYHGGGIAAADDATVDVTDSTFEDDVVDVRGPGQYPEGGAVRLSQRAAGTFTGCTFTDNHNLEHLGGAIGVIGRDASLVLEDCTFDGNTSGRPGGAVHLYDGPTLTVTGGTFTGSVAGEYGGAIGCNGGEPCTIEITGATFAANSAALHGGHVWVDNGTLVLTDTSFTGGDAGGDGGAVAVSGTSSALEATDVAFEDNHADGDGGALYVFQADATVLRPWACANTAGLDGGALKVEDTTSTHVSNGTFLANSAGDDGGAVRALDGSLTVAHTTFLGNVAANDGAAIAFQGPSDTVLVNASVLSGNSGPPAVDSTDGPVTAVGSAFWAHPQGDAQGDVTVLAPVELAADPFPELDPASCPALAVPAWGGELVDVAADADLDESVGDLGATGGPEADPALWDDADGDGVVVLWDCDDADGSVSPAEVEVPGNDVDEDCDGTAEAGTGGTTTTGGTVPGTTPVPAERGPATTSSGTSSAGCGCSGGGPSWLALWVLPVLCATGRARAGAAASGPR